VEDEGHWLREENLLHELALFRIGSSFQHQTSRGSGSLLDRRAGIQTVDFARDKSIIGLPIVTERKLANG
jgi:hypothetical protein